MQTTTPTPHLSAADEPELLVTEIARALGNTDDAIAEEIQYWYPEGSAPVEIADFYSVNPVPSLQYRVLATVPEGTTPDDLAAARSRATTKQSSSDVLELFTMPEQDVVQVMHHGRFADEFETLGRLGAFASRRGLHRTGPHHEVHLDAFTRQTPQDTLRTILRDPVG
jgi:effector-binding domain-containing protein